MPGPFSTGRRRDREPRRWAELVEERFEASRLGRALISLFLVVTVGAIAVANLPDSELRRALLAPAGPYLNATGLDQNWGVFAPDGRRFVVSLVARVRYQDGSTGEWRLPEAGPLLGAYWDYRWRKWAENVITLGTDGAAIRTPAATWIAAQMSRPGKRPVQVALVSRHHDLYPPGSPGGARGPWRESTFYRVNLRAAE